MTNSQLRKKKLQHRMGFVHEAAQPKASATTASTDTPAAPVKPSVIDLSFEEYKAADLTVGEQYALIGQIREEVPLAERDEVDSFMLGKAAKQLQLCVFPMCKMMHVDAKAVKKMLDEEFEKFYRLEKEEKTKEKMKMSTVTRKVTVDNSSVKDDIPIPDNRASSHDNTVDMEVVKDEIPIPETRESTREPIAFSNAGSRADEETEHPNEPPKKKLRRTQSAAQKAVKAYQAKKKRGKKRYYILTLKSKAAAEKWAALTAGA